MKILVVDDKAENIYLMEALFKGCGYETESASNGVEALERLRKSRFDLIISDILMPYMDGFKLCREAKADEKFRDIPFIFYTATYTDPKDEEFALKIGADRFIVKPCEPFVFLEAVKEVLATAKKNSSEGTFEPPKEEEALKLYSERLVKKLEEKMTQLEAEIKIRREAEAALMESEEKHRRLFETMPQGVVYQDAEGKIFNANAAAERILGLSTEAMRNLTSDDPRWRAIREDGSDFPGEAHPSMEALRTGKTIKNVIMGVCNQIEGRMRWIKIDAIPLFKPGDEKPSRVYATFDDVTERKRAEAERERLMTAVEQVDEMIFITDPDGKIQYVNPAFEKTTGYAREQAIGKSPRILKSGKQDADFYKDMWRTISDCRSWRGRLTNMRRNGSFYTEDLAISPVCDASGRIVNYVAVSRDITRDLEMEAQIFQAQKMETVGRLAGGVAHDFNNLLTIIMGNAELALTSVNHDSLSDMLLQIVRAGESATSLTRQLLAFSRKQMIEPKVCDLNDFLAGMNKMMNRLIGENIDLKLIFNKELGRVKIDPGQLEQVIINLAVNARDAMPDGGKLTMETANVYLDETYCQSHSYVKPGEFIMLSVTDTGGGISGEVREHIFEPFFTTKEKGKGTGLGLATVYGIAKQNGGDIQVYSEPGMGAEFKIYFPRVNAKPDVFGKNEAKEAPTGSETILLIEDEEIVLKFATNALKRQGYKVLPFPNGQMAINAIENYKEPVDLVFADVVMPGMNGREAAESIKKLRPAIKILFTSGYSGNALARHGTLEEGIAFISKPYSPQALAVKVRETLDKK